MSKSPRRTDSLLLTCEHGGNVIPHEYAHLFRGATRVVNSHRGWDPGALKLARFLGKFFKLPVYSVTWCRLLVESNRAPTNPRIWSQYTAGLPAAARKKILDRYWWPHRREVEAQIKRKLAQGHRVMHIAVHSFVPVFHGERRNADIGLLYDSRRPHEKAFCCRWQEQLTTMKPEIRVRRNYPYPGYTDGLCTWLRRRCPKDRYIGVELEINQAMLKGKKQHSVHQGIARSLKELLRD